MRKREIDRSIYAPNSADPMLYQMPYNYSQLNLRFFEDEERLVEKINNSDQKWLIFVSSIKKGEMLQEKINGAIFIDSSTKDHNSEFFDGLIKNETFDNKVLISTSVFINGNNIKDKKLCNVVIYQTDETEIKQAIGRKRFESGSCEKLNVFFKIPDIKTINHYLKSNQDIWGIVEKSDKDPAFLSRFLLRTEHTVENVKKIVYADKYGTFYFGELCLEKLKNEDISNREILKVLKINRANYCERISQFFSIDFNDEMLEMLDRSDDVLKRFYNECVAASPVDAVEYNRIVEKFNRIRKRFNLIDPKADNLGANRNAMQPRAFNARLKSLGACIWVYIREGLYYFEYLENDNVKA